MLASIRPRSSVEDVASSGAEIHTQAGARLGDFQVLVDVRRVTVRLTAAELWQLSEKLATTEGLLYRRGNFNGTFDQLILDAMLAVKGAEAILRKEVNPAVHADLLARLKTEL